MRWLRSYRPQCLPRFPQTPRRLRGALGWCALILLGLCSPALAAPTTQLPAGSPLRTTSAPPAIAADVTSCTSCHRMDPLFSHPVNVVPSMRVPADLPLQAGRVTCVTCHDPTTHNRARQTHDGMLRNATSTAELCARCHTVRDQSAKSLHAATLNRAHLLTSSRQAKANSFAPGVDAETYSCLTCHDGMMATGVTLGRDAGPGNHANSHPVGILYKEIGRPPGAPALAPSSSLDPRIRLFDQRVGCGSCHSPYSTQEKHLVMSNFHSKLCLSCHRE